jgi:hypothetical protein
VRPTIKGTKLFLLSFSASADSQVWKLVLESPSARLLEPKRHGSPCAAFRDTTYGVEGGCTSRAQESRARGMERMWLFHEDIELFHRAPLSLPRPHARACSRHLRFGHLGAPQRRGLGRSTTSVQHAADCSRESSVLKLAGPYM